ncbi:MAG: DUF3343 domain-containing protein [Desulfobacterota bacterium]|nr:DUF3343 domain-containing protein [Thermodesulfobacteriota bacterium]MCX7858443.1 DUF3343 domain-containing protein [Deltaproteobacteria bacterium]MDW8002357.1 DUF3343 domain-containing protein [Deltaproteobacteria bacterium]
MSYCYVLLSSINYVLAAEKIIKELKIPYSIVPVPRELSSDCGVCIRIRESDKNVVESLLLARFEDVRIEKK